MVERSEPAPGGSLIRPFLSERSPAPAASDAAAAGSVRPFLVTSGRTADVDAVPVETQVVATSQGLAGIDTLAFEYRDIVSLCSQPMAVAEIAARLGLHLGVARVIVTDLQRRGMVNAYLPKVAPCDDIDMIMRVIDGLRRRV
jgi:hypothetical protein